MFKLISNVGDWTVLFTSEYASSLLRNTIPSGEIDLSSKGLVTDKQGDITLEVLAAREGRSGERDRLLLLLSDDPATAVSVAGRLRFELGDQLTQIVEAQRLDEVSSQRLALERYCVALDRLCRPRRDGQLEPADKPRRRIVVLFVAILSLVATATFIIQETRSAGSRIEALEGSTDKRLNHLEGHAGHPELPGDAIARSELISAISSELSRATPAERDAFASKLKAIIGEPWKRDATQEQQIQQLLSDSKAAQTGSKYWTTTGEMSNENPDVWRYLALSEAGDETVEFRLVRQTYVLCSFNGGVMKKNSASFALRLNGHTELARTLANDDGDTVQLIWVGVLPAGDHSIGVIWRPTGDEGAVLDENKRSISVILLRSHLGQ